ncbi:unnamed protein product [Phytophthora lilii]|uniref:Unnamed protein product n=1 Tax=Phytophthora lilii TaxID=2077276 RepID=A0A9W6U3R3_9STRA|nr:unnamed protein product [Phytophthora lilii]
MEATPVPTATPVPADNELEQQQQDDPPTDIPEVETQPPEVEHDATAEKEEAQATDPLTQPDTATQEQSAHHDEQMTDDRLKDDSPGDAVHPDDQGDQRGQGQADQGDHGDQGEQGNQGDQAGGNDQVSGVQADPAEAFSIETQLPVDQIQEGFAQGKQAEKAATPSTVRVDPIEPHPKVQELKQDDSLAAADTHTTQDQPHPTAAARHSDKEEGDAIPAASPARGEKQNIQGIVNETPRQPNQPGRGDAKPSAAPTPLNQQQQQLHVLQQEPQHPQVVTAGPVKVETTAKDANESEEGWPVQDPQDEAQDAEPIRGLEQMPEAAADIGAREDENAPEEQEAAPTTAASATIAPTPQAPTAAPTTSPSIAEVPSTPQKDFFEIPTRQNDEVVVMQQEEATKQPEATTKFDKKKDGSDTEAPEADLLKDPNEAEAEMQAPQEKWEVEDSGNNDATGTPQPMAPPMDDETLPPVRRSQEFLKALDLVHLPKTKPPNPNFHVFPVNKNVPGDNSLLVAGLRNNAADRESWTVEGYQHELERLEGLKREANEETERLKLLVGAADKLIAEEKDRLENKRAASTLDIRLHQPRKIRNNLKCMGWRQTGQCNPYGKREPNADLACNQIAQGGVSGYCEVLDEATGELFRVMQLNCSSVRDHVVFSCAEAADFANFGLMAQGVYENAITQNASDPSKLLGNNGSGNGIVMVVYPKLLSSVFASISVLRSYNCTLPIELWISQPEVVRSPSMRTTLDMFQQRFSNVTVETIIDPTVAGFSTKIHAVQHSKFENVLFLDADNVPVRDPTFLFESREFREHGAIFWPDFWHPEKTIFNIQRESLLWELVDLPFVDMFEQESGQILINRKQAAVALEVLMFFAYHRPSHFERLVLAHGDKDLFRLAWMKTQTSFYMMPFPPASAGTERGTYKKQFCGMTMVQFDVNGNVLFLHRNAKKLDGKVDKLDPKYWTHLQSFKWEQEVTVGDGEDIMFPANRTAVQRMMSYEDIKQKYQIGIQPSGPLFKEFESCYGAEPNVVGNYNLTKFEDLPFANLEQELIDYAHEGGLLMAQAQGRMGVALEQLRALAGAVASSLFGATRSPHTVQSVDFGELLEPPRAANFDVKQTLRRALAAPLRACPERSLFVLHNVQALDDAALPVLDVFLDPLNGKRAQFQQHVEGQASRVFDCANSVFLFLYEVAANQSPLDGENGGNWREFLMQQWTRAEGTIEEFTPQAFVGRLTDAVAVFLPEGDNGVDADYGEFKKSREWHQMCELRSYGQDDEPTEDEDSGEYLATAALSLIAENVAAAADPGSIAMLSVPAFLGHTISGAGLHVDVRKTRAIAEWPEPGNVQELQRVLRPAGYYRRFIHGFAQLVLPLSSLVKHNVDWVWDEPQRRAFNSIKLALQQAPVLRLPDFDRPFIVTTDASHDCIGGWLSQMHDGHDLPMAFYSKKLGVHELNWPVHEKELFAIKQALTRWHHYLHGYHFDVVTDNSACKWFLQHPRVSGRLAPWLDFFASFNFVRYSLRYHQLLHFTATSNKVSALAQLGGGECKDLFGDLHTNIRFSPSHTSRASIVVCILTVCATELAAVVAPRLTVCISYKGAGSARQTTSQFDFQGTSNLFQVQQVMRLSYILLVAAAAIFATLDATSTNDRRFLRAREKYDVVDVDDDDGTDDDDDDQERMFSGFKDKYVAGKVIAKIMGAKSTDDVAEMVQAR